MKKVITLIFITAIGACSDGSVEQGSTTGSIGTGMETTSDVLSPASEGSDESDWR